MGILSWTLPGRTEVNYEFCQDRCLGRNSNQAPLGKESQALPLRHSVSTQEEIEWQNWQRQAARDNTRMKL
jgi:hypothetical protein